MTNNIQKDAYTAHGTLLSVTGLPRWEGSSGGKMNTYVQLNPFTVVRLSQHC